MPPKKKNASNRAAKLITYSVGFVTIGALVLIVFLWWKSRQVQFIEYKEFGIAIPSNYQIHGIDVSRYQQRISWAAVKKMQVDGIKLHFAFIKATEGNGNVDPFFKRNWKNTKEAGVVRGAYHFFIASRDGKKQAQNFIKRVTLESGDLPPVLDIEQTNGTSATVIREKVKIWMKIMEENYGVKPIIYTNVDFYQRFLKGHFDDYPLWIAHYLKAHQPRIDRDWHFWQYSEDGRVNGIRSRVDFNVFNGDPVEFQSLLVP